MVKGAVFELLETSWPTLVIFLVIIILFRIFYHKNSGKRIILHEEILQLVFVTYILLLFELVTDRDVVMSGTNLIPFKEILRYKVGSANFYKQVIGNIVMFIPFGFFASYYTKSKKMSNLILMTFLASLTIEIVQKYIGRSFDIDDIILNVLGGMLGFFIYVGLDAISKKMPKFFRRDAFLSFLSILVLALVVLYLIGIINLGVL